MRNIDIYYASVIETLEEMHMELVPELIKFMVDELIILYGDDSDRQPMGILHMRPYPRPDLSKGKHTQRARRSRK